MEKNIDKNRCYGCGFVYEPEELIEDGSKKICECCYEAGVREMME